MSPQQTRPGRSRLRLLGLAGAVLLNEALWLVGTFVLGLQLQAPAASPDLQPTPIGPLLVGVASLVTYALGWGGLALLERLTAHARRIWSGIALVALAASLMLPLSGTGVDAPNRLVLVLMHVAVAAILISIGYRTAAPSIPAALPTPTRARVSKAA